MQVSLDVSDEQTGEQLLARLAEKQGWKQVAQLLRLDGFVEPWERLLCRWVGRAVGAPAVPVGG